MNEQLNILIDGMNVLMQKLNEMTKAEAPAEPAQATQPALKEEPPKEEPRNKLDMVLRDEHMDRRYAGHHYNALPRPTYREILGYVMESCNPLYEDAVPVRSVTWAALQHIKRVHRHVLPNGTGVRYALHLAGLPFGQDHGIQARTVDLSKLYAQAKPHEEEA